MVSALEHAVAALNGDVVEPEINFNPYAGYLTKRQLADAIKRGERTLDNWHRNHIGPPRIKFGGVILYNIEAFKTWLAAQELPHGKRAKPPGQSYFRPTQRQKRPRGRPRKQPPPTAAAE